MLNIKIKSKKNINRIQVIFVSYQGTTTFLNNGVL